MRTLLISFHLSPLRSLSPQPQALTSIVNRVTGVALTGGWAAVGALAATGDLPAVVDAAASTAWVAPAFKGALALPLSYHFWGGVRHLAWDHARLGQQNRHDSILEKETIGRGSAAVVGLSLATAAAAVAFL